MNAIQALENSGVVSIGIFDDPQDHNNVLVKISDTGIGIADEIKEKIPGSTDDKVIDFPDYS